MYVYVAGTDDGPVKIGFSKNPQTRIRMLVTASPKPFRIASCFRLSNPNFARAIEQSVHKELSGKRMAGEWFDVSPAEAASVVVKAVQAAGLEAVDIGPLSKKPVPPRTVSMSAKIPHPGGRPKSEITKTPISIRLDDDVLAYYRSLGDGWQSRMNDLLRKAAGL